MMINFLKKLKRKLELQYSINGYGHKKRVFSLLMQYGQKKREKLVPPHLAVLLVFNLNRYNWTILFYN